MWMLMVHFPNVKHIVKRDHQTFPVIEYQWISKIWLQMSQTSANVKASTPRLVSNWTQSFVEMSICCLAKWICLQGVSSVPIWLMFPLQTVIRWINCIVRSHKIYTCTYLIHLTSTKASHFSRVTYINCWNLTMANDFSCSYIFTKKKNSCNLKHGEWCDSILFSAQKNTIIRNSLHLNKETLLCAKRKKQQP